MIRRTTLLGCVLVLALPIVGCDGDPAPVDAGQDAGPMEIPPPLLGFGAARDALTAGDYSCRGTRTAPAGAADSAFSVTATDFFSSMPVEGLSVDFFSNNVVTADCSGANCTNVTTDATGVASVTAPEGGWYGYRINAGDGTHMDVAEAYVTAVQTNEVTPAAAGSETLNAVRQSTVNTLTSVLLIQQQPGTSIITGQALDCAGNPIANARIRVFGDDGQVMFGRQSSGPKSFYFDGSSFPNASESETQVDGLYGAGNIPVPASGEVRVELWGVVTDGMPMEMLGCETVTAVPDGITVINVGATRSDGPSGCSG